MQIVKTQNNNVTVVALKGRLDSAAAPSTEKQLTDMLESGVSRIVLDCSELEYISSAGLRIMLSLAKRVDGAQGHLALATPQKQVREILDVAGFSDILSVYALVDEAVAACGK